MKLNTISNKTWLFPKKRTLCSVNTDNFLFNSIDEFTPPTQVKLRKNKDELEISWPDRTCVFPAELLRVESPSVEVQGFLPGQKKVVHGKKDVKIYKIVPQGTYAISLYFDDLHSTGIYPWRFLYDLGVNMDKRMNDYLAELERLGLSRERSNPLEGKAKRRAEE